MHKLKNTKQSKCRYSYYQNTHTLQNPHIHTPHITKQGKTTTVQDTQIHRELVIDTLPSYTSISNAAVGNIFYS